ncbi:MAG: CHAT domain-containing protein [Rivularia sp. T60_A2020_040]|nr:CHAT domain-containing protein [Rivularia sp. T60_A2020_040]
MSKKHHDVRVIMHRAFAVFLTVFLISDVGRVYASRNLEIIAQQGETQPDVTRAEAVKLTEEGLELFNKQGGKESLLAARKKLEAALVLWQKLGDKTFQAATLLGIGRIYSDLAEKQKALQYYNQALPLYREVGDRSGEATILNNIAVVYSDLGTQQRESSPSDATEAEALKLTQEGFQLQKQGSKESLLAARKKHEAALVLWQKLGNKTGQVVTLLNIGRIYDDVGEKQKALQFYNQALPVLRAVRNRGGEATALNNIGLVYDDLGEKQKALEFYEQALPLSRALGDRRREATTLNNIGSVYSDLGEKQKALEFYEQALPLRREVADKGGEAATLNNIGRIYSEHLGEKQKALQEFKQALDLYRAVGDKGGEALTLNNIGSVYDDLGEKQKALQSYNQALPLYRAVGDRGGEVINLNSLAYLEHKQGNLQASLKYIESAIAIIEELRTTYTNQDLKTSYFSTVQDYYRGYINILMDLHKKNPSQGYDAIALHISERSRARGLIELLAQANAKLSKNVDPKFIAEEQELQLKRQAQEKILVQLINQTSLPKDKIKETETEIQNIINQQKQLKAKIRAQNPERDKITNPEPLKLPEIQQQLDKDTVLLQYSLGKERSYLWLVTPTSLTSYELPKGEEIEQIANRFHSQLSSNGFPVDSAQKLSEIILKPVKDQITGKRLVIVADGVLQQIPFAALADLTPQTPSLQENGEQDQLPSPLRAGGNARGGLIPEANPGVNINNTNYQPLMLNHEIVNLPSASTIAIQREKIAKRKIAPKKIAILADPVYTSNDQRVTGKEETISPELDLERSALQRSAKSLNRSGWLPLPNTKTEAEEILKLFPSTDTLQAFSFDANYNFATSKNLNQYQILHFATHGFVNPNQPELSGIVLSLVNQDGKQIPGYLRLADLFEQDYPAELIVLSACETGLGKNVSGEGLVGLTRGLMYAGAARVALSLWQVDDEGTSVLMQEFYKQMLQENKTPSEALRAAQRKLWANPDWRNPYYWGAFTLQGEWK